MNADYIRLLVQYNYDLYRQVWDCISYLTEAQFVEETGYSLGSVRNHMVHVMGVDERWLARIRQEPLPQRLEAAEFRTQAQVRSYWDSVDAHVREYVHAVDDTTLQQVRQYDMPHRGGMKTNRVWEIMAHMVNHGTDHRAQVLMLLHHFGAPTLEQDLMIYLWDSLRTS